MLTAHLRIDLSDRGPLLRAPFFVLPKRVSWPTSGATGAGSQNRPPGNRAQHPRSSSQTCAKLERVGYAHHRQPSGRKCRYRALPRSPPKRAATVVDITSSRMPTWWTGFLRRVFQVFERFTTAVGMYVVTTSEVSASVLTVDDRRHLYTTVEARCRRSLRSCSSTRWCCSAPSATGLRNEPAIAAKKR